jgi:FkbM family methyltransferase
MGGRSTAVAAQHMKAMELIIASSPKADEVIKANFSDCKAQMLQDMVCLLVHEQKRGGTFVEVGVGNGVDFSNTYVLEKKFNWSGLLIEPNRSSMEEIKAARSAVLDTRAASAVSGASVSFEEIISEKLYSHISGTGVRQFGEHEKNIYEVETVTLDDAFKQHELPSSIDFLSIDTEGNELDVLAGVNMDKYQIGFLAVEHNYRAGDLAALKKLLEPKGYRQILPEISMVDAWFVHSSIRSCHIG